MAIIDIFKAEKKDGSEAEDGFLSDVSFVDEGSSKASKKSWSKDSAISFVCIRLFFVALLGCTVIWFAYALCKTVFFSAIKLCFLSSDMLSESTAKSWLSLKRSFICGISLVLATLTPALGIMIACTYFLMYDKSGVEEVVPSSLRDQFKDLFAQTAEG